VYSDAIAVPRQPKIGLLFHVIDLVADLRPGSSSK
jgi:hypothetical protein